MIERYSDRDLIRQIRAAARAQPRLTSEAYEKLARTHGWARSLTIRNRFGSWNAALAAADIDQAHMRAAYAMRPCACGDPAYARGRCRSHYIEHMELHGHEYGKSKRYVYVNVEGRRRFEHRVVMEAILGRALLRDETIHHAGARNDNRPSRIELRVGSHGPGLTVPEVLQWAHEIIARYET